MSQDGYRLELLNLIGAAGPATPVRLRVLGTDGDPVREYEVSHEQRTHLIAIRRDSTGSQHVHPVMDDEGTWTLDLDLTPGQRRLFTDFAAPDSPGLTLGADRAVPGPYDPAALSQPSRVAEVPGGYTVSPPGRHEHRAVTMDTRWRHERFTSGGDCRGCLTPRCSVRQPLLPAIYRRGPTRATPPNPATAGRSIDRTGTPAQRERRHLNANDPVFQPASAAFGGTRPQHHPAC